MNSIFKLKPKKIDYKTKTIISLVLVMTALAVIIVFIDIPNMAKIKKLSQEIQFQRVDLEKKYVIGQRTKKIALSVNKIETEMSKFDNVFINDNRELEFITQLETVAAKNNLKQELNLNKDQSDAANSRGNKKMTPAKSLIRSTTIYIKLEGKYDDLINYLSDLETLEYYININGLDLSESKDENYNLSIKALTYWK